MSAELDWTSKRAHVAGPGEALHNAALNGHTDIVRELLAHKRIVHACEMDAPLAWAAYRGHTDIVRVLLAYKADVHACGLDGLTDEALRWAAFHGHADTVRVLLAHKADVHACDCYGRPDEALRDAAEYGRTETLRLLITHKANVHACGRNEKPDGALCMAAQKKHVDAVWVLLQAGADVQACPKPFLRKHFSTSALSMNVSSVVGLGLRLGVRVLREIETAATCGMNDDDKTQSSWSFRVLDFERARASCVMALQSASCFSCKDLCDLVLSYV